MDFVKENFVWIVVIICLLIALANIKWQQYKKGRLRKKRFERGAKLEANAAEFLKRKGFEILNYQAVHYHHYQANGQDKKAKLEIDYVVAKGNRTYLVEVKSGAQATQIENKVTRRQILEYCVAVENDGVFLLDMETESLQKIEFESIRKKDAGGALYYRLALLLLVCGSAASPNWDAKSIFIGVAILFVSFPNAIGGLLSRLK